MTTTSEPGLRARDGASATTAQILAAEDACHVPVYAKMPIAIVRGAGSRVWDADGRAYLDMYGGHCVALAGHSPPELVAAIAEQAARLIFYSNLVYNDARARACTALAALAPQGLRRVFLCNSGTEANETALKIARKDTGRRHVLSMSDGFHGRTLGSLGATGLAKYRDGAWPIPVDHGYLPYGDLDALAAQMDRDIAAVMLEPVPSMGGIRVAPRAYFEGLRALCDRHGALLIFDEVQTGFGRTGAPFFAQTVGVRPDLIAAAKGVAGGFPAGVVFVREDISARMQPGEQGTTFGGGPLACAAIDAVARLIVERDLPGNARRVGAQLVERLPRIAGVRSVTGAGLLLGVNLDRPAKGVVARLRELGVLCGGCEGDPQQIRLLPPLTLSAAEADEFAGALAAALAGAPA